MYSKLILEYAYREVEEKNCRFEEGNIARMESLQRVLGIAFSLSMGDL